MAKQSSQMQARAPQVPSAVSRLLKLIAPWKELAAIAVFFGAGVAWVASYFATKKQLDALECYARESVAVARAETSLRGTFDELIQKGLRIDTVEGRIRDGSATEFERVESKRLQREIRDLEKRRDAATTRLDAAQKSLDDGMCHRDNGK